MHSQLAKVEPLNRNYGQWVKDHGGYGLGEAGEPGGKWARLSRPRSVPCGDIVSEQFKVSPLWKITGIGLSSAQVSRHACARS